MKRELVRLGRVWTLANILQSERTLTLKRER
jgi:hypothetical protein